jgi:hypothetical protein
MAGPAFLLFPAIALQSAFNGDLQKDFAVMTNVNIVHQAFRVA